MGRVVVVGIVCAVFVFVGRFPPVCFPPVVVAFFPSSPRRSPEGIEGRFEVVVVAARVFAGEVTDLVLWLIS